MPDGRSIRLTGGCSKVSASLEEKGFSLFEPHTEWICKGTAGVPMELGLRVNVVEDRDRFILHHQVMERTTDDQVAIAMVDETQQRFPQLRAISMDKGFHSPTNQAALKERLECVVLPRKGRRSQADKARESEPEFSQLRRRTWRWSRPSTPSNSMDWTNVRITA